MEIELKKVKDEDGAERIGMKYLKYSPTIMVKFIMTHG